MNARHEVCNLATDLKKVIRDSEDLLAAVGGESAQAVGEELGRLVKSAKEACIKLEEKAKQSLSSTDDAIRSHPYQSIGVAAALGLVIGVLIAKK